MLKFWELVFWISAAQTLVVPGGHFLGSFFMAFAGFFYWRRAISYSPVTDPLLKKSWFWLLGGFGCLVVFGLGLGLWHSNHLGHYEMYVPFVLFPAIGLLVRAGRWKAEPWLLSWAVGAFLAFIYAAYQVIGQSMGRAEGASGNPIPFGNTAVVFGAVAFVTGVMFPFQGDRAKWKRSVLFVSGVAGLGASLLSGSKGGWLSLFFVVATVVYLCTKGWATRRRSLVALLAILLLFLAGLLMPLYLVKDRLISGLNGGWQWFQTGEVAEASASMRLEIWRLTAVVISEKPWLGHGSLGAHQRWEELSHQAGASPMLKQLYGNQKFVSFESELIGALAGGGVLGALGLFMGYWGVWMAFWRWRNHPDAQIKTLSTIGLLQVVMYLMFGLSVSVFGTNVFRSVYVSLSISLLALLSVRLQRLRKPA